MPDEQTNDLHAIRETLAAMLSVFQSMAQSLQLLADRFKITGIEISPGTPTKENPLKVTLVKKSALKTASPKAQHGAAVVAFTLVDNENDTCTVLGTDAAGNTLDISTIATLTPPPTSDNTTVLTVGAPSGMTFNMKAVGPTGSANVTATATWNDGSIGPFKFTLPVNVVSGGATGIVIQPGIPTVS